jgi:MYXO-CTERM domain-containing protein
MRPSASALPAALLALAAIWLAPATARADVPFHKVYLTNAVEVADLDKFPDWVVVVFPYAPPSGRPVAWPALVEAGFQTVIDRKVLGTPRLYILPRAALDELAAAARDNDDALDGPVDQLLRQKGVECAKVDLQDSADVPFTTPENRLASYRLEDAAAGRCAMKLVKAEITGDEFKQPPSWARYMPKKKKADAGAGPSAATPRASAAPLASASAAAAYASAIPFASASAPPPAPPASAAAREPQVPERAKGCGACAVGGDGGAPPAGLGALLVAAVGVARGRRRSRRSA